MNRTPEWGDKRIAPGDRALKGATEPGVAEAKVTEKVNKAKKTIYRNSGKICGI